LLFFFSGTVLETAQAAEYHFPKGTALTALLLVLLLFFVNQLYPLPQAMIAVDIALLALMLFTLAVRHKQALLYLLAFLIPVSVQQEVFEGSKISFPSEVICVVFAVFFFVKLFTGRRISRDLLMHPVTLIIITELGWILLCSCFSGMPAVSFKRFTIKLIYYVTFYHFYFELFRLNARNIKNVLLIHVCGLLVPIAITLYRHRLIGFKTVGSQLLSSPFYNDHTMYGAALVFFLPFLFFSILKKGNVKKEKLMFFFLFLIFSVAIFFSYSRAAWMSIIIAGLVGLFILLKIRKRTVIILMVLGIAASLVNWGNVTNYFLKNRQRSHSNNIGMHFKSVSNISDDSNRERINRWKCALKMFADKPILGFGPGTYQFFYGKYQVSSDLSHLSSFNGSKGHAHSEYLNVLSENGLPGLIIFLSLIATVLYKAFRLAQQSKEKETRFYAFCLLLGLITFFVHAFFNGFIEFEKLAMPVFSSFAAIVYLDLKENNKLTT
jgi:O-antigen ligase